jgi:L-lactate dehydrogenase
VIPLDEFCDQWEICLDQGRRQIISTEVQRAAYNIIGGKGATYYGVGSAIAKIVEVILGDQRSILTVCTPMDEVAGVKDVTLSLPHLLGGKGVLNRLNVPLTKKEAVQLNKSASLIKSAIDELKL